MTLIWTDDFIDGISVMPWTCQIKFKYELHYWDTNVSGSSQGDWCFQLDS